MKDVFQLDLQIYSVGLLAFVALFQPYARMMDRTT
jgi:hypothetical protein